MKTNFPNFSSELIRHLYPKFFLPQLQVHVAALCPHPFFQLLDQLPFPRCMVAFNFSKTWSIFPSKVVTLSSKLFCPVESGVEVVALELSSNAEILTELLPTWFWRDWTFFCVWVDCPRREVTWLLRLVTCLVRSASSMAFLAVLA